VYASVTAPIIFEIIETNNQMKTKHLLLFLPFLLLQFNAVASCEPSFITSIAGQNDTVCIGVQVDFTNTSDVSGNISSYQWNFGDLSPFGTTEHASHIYTTAGLYTVTLTVTSDNCSTVMFQDTVYVIFPPSVSSFGAGPLCYGECNGAASVTITGSHSNYHILWDDPSQQDTQLAIGLCEGEYIATVTDDFGCMANSPMVALFDPDMLVADAGNDIFICPGDNPVQIQATVEGGTSPYFYSWEPIADLDLPDVLNPTLTPTGASSGIYFLTVTDDNGCIAGDSMEVQMTLATISGRVFNSATGAPVAGDTVYLIKKDAPLQPWKILDKQKINSTDGSYSFSNVPLDEVIVYARPNMTAPLTALPTFSGDTAFWEGATGITPGCGEAVQHDIHCVIPAATGPFTCRFKGRVSWCCGKKETEDPIPLIDVVVKKTPPGNAWTSDTTDSNGDFSIEDIAVGDTFSFVINIPGVGMTENYYLVVSADDSLFQNLNFYVDTTMGASGVFINNPNGIIPLKYDRKEMLAYPNPFSDNCQLRFPNDENGTFGFVLYDISGKLILSEQDLQGNNYLLRTEALEKGVYIAEVKTDVAVYRSRVMKR